MKNFNKNLVLVLLSLIAISCNQEREDIEPENSELIVTAGKAPLGGSKRARTSFQQWNFSSWIPARRCFTVDYDELNVVEVYNSSSSATVKVEVYAEQTGTCGSVHSDGDVKLTEFLVPPGLNYDVVRYIRYNAPSNVSKFRIVLNRLGSSGMTGAVYVY